MSQNVELDNINTKKLNDTIYNLFNYISTDPCFDIKKDYINFNNSINQLLKLSPKEISVHYLNYIESLNLDKMPEIEKINYYFLNNYKNTSEEQFRQILKFEKTNQPKEFLFCLYLWLFIWH